MSKHTPGPWRVALSDVTIDLFHQGRVGMLYASVGGLSRTGFCGVLVPT